MNYEIIDLYLSYHFFRSLSSFCCFCAFSTLICIYVFIIIKATKLPIQTVCNDVKRIPLSSINPPSKFIPGGNLEYLWNYKQIKAYKSKIMARNWAILSKLPITGLNDTLQGVIDSFDREGNCKIYFFGGGIRDAVLGRIGGDLDATTTCKWEKFIKICIGKYGYQNCFSPKPKTRIIRIGSAKTDSEKKNEIVSIDISSFSGTFEISPAFWEYTVNYVVYDPQKNILLDMTGKSLGDQCNKEFDIPVPQNQWNNWTIKDGILKALRFWNLEEKGFKPANPLISKFIIETLDRIFDKEIVQGYLCLKFFRGYFENGQCYIHSYSNQKEEIFQKWIHKVEIEENTLKLSNKLKDAFYSIKFKQQIY